MRRLLTALALALGLLMGLSSAAAADFKDGTVNISDLSANPAADAYSPWAWTSAWAPDAADYDELAQGDLKTGLIATGLVIGDGDASEQWDALTPEEQEQLQTQWKTGLLGKIRDVAMDNKVTNHEAASGDDVFVAPQWSTSDADAAAQLLGGVDYASLTPGLKGVVQRVAVIVTGDRKPPMPDDAWTSWMPAATKADYDAAPASRYNWERNVAFNVTPSPDSVTRACDPDFPGFMVSFCQTVQGAVGAVEDAAGAAAAAADFVSDPIGWLSQKMAEGATAVFDWVATTANTATMPDLTSSWWISAYMQGMAAGIIIFFFVLMWQFAQLAKGNLSQDELLDTFTSRLPAFFAGLVFGPPLAQFMIVGAGQLTDDIVSSMTGSTGEATEAITAAITSAGTGNILGGSIVAMLILLVLLIACFFIFIALCVQTVAIYISSAVFAIAFAWIADARRTGGSMRIPLLFLGLVFSRPLLFFLLSIGMGMVKGAFSGEADGGAQELGMLVMAIVLLCMVAFSPMLLLQLAPVMPTGSGPSPSGGSSGGGSSGGGSPRGSAFGGGSGGGATGGGAGGGSAVQQLARPSAAADAGSGGSAGSAGGAGAVAGGTATGASGSKQSGTAAVAKSGTGRGGADPSASGGVGPLGRSRRHGGGAPSPAAAAMLAATSGSGPSRGRGSSSGSASSGGPGGGSGSAGSSSGSGSGAGRIAGAAGGLGSKVRSGAQKAQAPMASAAKDMGGGQSW